MNLRLLSRRHWPLLFAITLSAILSSWALGTVGWGNTYYSAAVRSMSQSWHAFWYGSLDSVGFVTVDKPPFSMWVQALVVKVFGFHSMSLLVPQVLAGVATVVIVYVTLVRTWGRFAATTASLALAVTPISVMVNHSNNTDAILTLMMTATLGAGVRAMETRSTRWVVVTGLLFGAAFTTKMLAAAPVLPAVLIAFALTTTFTMGQRMRFLAIGSLVAIVSALAWFSWVDLTPSANRPYVGSSFDNSAFQLAFERNGVNQVEGGQVMTGGPAPSAPDTSRPGIGGNNPVGGPSGLPGRLRQMMRGFEGGEPGPLRLFNSELGSQLGWLVLPAALSLVATVFLRRRAWRDPVVVTGAVWAAGGVAAYSVTKGIVHPYYLASIAPPMAILVGVGTGVIREQSTRRWTATVIGSAVTCCGLASWVIARRAEWTIATNLATLTVMAGVMLAVMGAFVAVRSRWTTLAALLILIVPFAWTVGSLHSGLSANLPYADPTNSLEFGRPVSGGPGLGPSVNTSVVDYLVANRGDTKWMVATPSAMAAGPIIIETGEPVMALGGFSGGDDIVTADDFDRLVDNGDIRFVLIDSRGQGSPGGTRRDIMNHITSTCALVDGLDGLYDCRS